MNYIYCIVTTLSFFALQQCFAMKNKLNATPAKIIHTINTIQKPQSVVSFQGDIIAIEGHEECSIYNIAKKQEIYHINNCAIRCIAGHPTKPLLAIIDSPYYSDQAYLRIYNALTGDRIAELSQNSLQAPLAFNSMNNTLIARYCLDVLYVYNSKTLAKITSYNMNNAYTPKIEFNPKKNECAFYLENNMTIANSLENLTTNKKVSITHAVTALIYSSDGSCIICNTYNNKYYVFDSLLNFKTYDGNFKAIAMNPTSLILAGLSVKNECIDYINTQKNGAFIASTNLKTFNIAHFYHQKYIQFSSDGKRIIIVGNDACYVLEVPFDALYQPGTKENCTRTLWVLRNCVDNKNELLLQDIKHLLIRYLLDVCKYSFTNH